MTTRPVPSVVGDEADRSSPLTVPVSVKLRTFFPALWGFMGKWINTREYGKLWRGIPAILVASFVVFGMLSQAFYDKGAKARHYQVAAHTAIREQRFEDAALYFNRLRQLDAMDDATQFRAALVQEHAGDLQGAWVAMAKIAPTDKAGHIPAHLWIASQLGSGRTDLPEHEIGRLARRHLELILDDDPKHIEALNMLATLLTQREQYRDAEARLRQLIELRPEARLLLVQLYDRQAKRELMEEEARTLVNYYEQSDTDLPLDSYPRWGQAHAVLKQFAKAEEVMQRATKLAPNNPKMRASLSRVYSTWARVLADEEPENFERQIELLDLAIKANPADPIPWTRIAELTAHDGQTGDEARAVLHPVLAQGKAPAIVHLVLGTIAASEENHESAKLHLEKAVELNPNGAVVLNNLAWILGKSDDAEDNQRALELVDRAIELDPKNPEYRETRGQLLVKKGDWRTAIADLEAALERNPDSQMVLQSLALAYEQLGQKELSEAFRARVDERPDR